MSDSVSTTDRILDIIDAGLQSSSEHGYGTDNPEACARCQTAKPVKDGDLCEGCRAFLLGDSDRDLAGSTEGVPASEAVANLRDALLDAAAPTVSCVVDAFTRIASAIDPVLRQQERFLVSCEALGLTRMQGGHLWQEECPNAPDAETVQRRATERAQLAAADLDPGPPGIQGDIWRRMFDPNRTPPPANELDYWWRRTRAANEAREPLTVTPEQYREIRLLCPDPLDPLAPIRLRVEDGVRETLFGVELAIERYEWADADRIHARVEFEAGRRLARELIGDSE